MTNEDLKKELQQLASLHGASLFGVAGTARFVNAPKGHHPQDFIPETNSVISIGIRIPTAVLDYEHFFIDSELIPASVRQKVITDHFYQTVGYDIPNRQLEQIAFLLALHLEEQGYKTLFFPSTFSEAQKSIQALIPSRSGIFSHRHAAVLSGLGEFGLNNLVVTEKYGPRVRFITVITEASIPADPLPDKSICLGAKCSQCIKVCGTRALTVNEPTTGPRRSPESRTDIPVCSDGRKEAMCLGRCILVCPVGQR
jgi:epoxyqueuosine reductase QueG